MSQENKIETLFDFCTKTTDPAGKLIGKTVSLGTDASKTKLSILSAKANKCWASLLSQNVSIATPCSVCKRAGTDDISVMLGDPATKIPIINLICCESIAADFYFVDEPTKNSVVEMSLDEIKSANKSRNSCIKCGSPLRMECWFAEVHRICDNCEGG